ncbi:Ku protein [Achromobacter pestifer]|uniref:Non-homologous end joining protein Ku n=1 Tax=Achromobacter pestifer TaxID=1353889 RepID=A0A6S6Z2S5_9BURK|nr:Ku protein [Achromobacter pestifer]CAB3647468.1 Non-homologous end joining protein Ku [Achromobacter pestifer]
MADDDGKAPTSTRTMWKGAISFGLVHIPVGLYSATVTSGIDFDWLDKRSMEPVGYKRINKVTGEEIASSDIVKGVEYEDGRYVILSPEEIAAAFPKTTQTIEIETFLDADEIPFVYLERPYYTAPLKRGEKVYALLREALRKSNKVGVATVVIQTKQHLAVLIPCGRALILNLLRWGGEIRSFEQLNLPPLDAKAAGIKDAEMTMAMQLIEDMTQKWDADNFRNSFADEINKLIETKAEAGEIADVVKVERESSVPAGADVLDLTALLKRSLDGGKKSGSAQGAPASVTALPSAKRAPTKSAPAKKAPAKKTPAGKAAKTAPPKKTGRRTA